MELTEDDQCVVKEDIPITCLAVWRSCLACVSGIESDVPLRTRAPEKTYTAVVIRNTVGFTGHVSRHQKGENPSDPQLHKGAVVCAFLFCTPHDRYRRRWALRSVTISGR